MILRPFAVEFFLCFESRFYRGFQGLEAAKNVLRTFVLYESDVLLSCCVEAHAFMAGFVVFLRSSVAMVLGWSGLPKIFPAVIRLIFVTMIDLVFRPRASHPEPDDSVRHVVFAINPDLDSVVSLFTPRDFSYGRADGKPHSPGQQPGAPVVSENFSDVSSCEIVMRFFVGHFRMLTSEGVIVNAP